MDTTRIGRPARVRIESDGTNGAVSSRTRVLIDGQDITNLVTAVTWHLGAGEGPATATVTFLHVDIAAEAEFAYTPEDWARLREFAPNLADAIENTKPVEGRAKVVRHGAPFTPQTPPAGLKRTPEQWCDHYGVEIQDSDGWREKDAPAWDEPITLPEFWARARSSTLRNAVGDGWAQVGRDAVAASKAESGDAS